MNKQFIYSGLIALLVSIGSFWAINSFNEPEKTVRIEHVSNVPSQSTLFSVNENGELISLDFQKTAEAVLDGVVHIKSTHIYNTGNNNYEDRFIPEPFRDFFGDEFKNYFGRPQPQKPKNYVPNPMKVGTGSGVIVSSDGYIITNNHVIDNADDIEITLHDNRTFKAVLVGTDPSTDIALLRIKAEDLNVVPFVDSDEVNIGQWVMAVGNPMGLNSTVTAGIVSAKGRNINILKEKYAVENFIQTDAAINPGNSGGALVNLNGGLIGINTAIASPTGTFAGYGFAVPSNIVEKVMEDLIKYGSVQRGVLGIMIRTVDGNLAKEEGLSINSGVYVDSLLENSAAKSGGVKVGDVILRVNQEEVKSSPELQGKIAQYRPGDEVELLINRNGKDKIVKVTLTNKDGNAEVISDIDAEINKILGVVIEDITKDVLKDLEIKSGVRVKKVLQGNIKKHTQMRDGFIITHMDGEKVQSKKAFLSKLKSKKGGVMLEGVYENLPGEYYYAFGL